MSEIFALGPFTLNCTLGWRQWLAAMLAMTFFFIGTTKAIVPAYEVRDGAVHLKGVGPDNPILYDNDWWFDVFDNNYLWARTSLGRVDLRGSIVSRDMWEWDAGYKYSMEQCLNDAAKALKLARDSGLKNIPDPTPGANVVLRPPTSGRLDDTDAMDSPGAQLIIREARKASPEKPLIIVAGGPLTTVANALLLAPDIAPRLVVFNILVTHYGYNGKDGWAAYIVAKKTRYVDWGGRGRGFWDKNAVFTAKDFESLPKNPFCEDMRRLIQSDLGQTNQLGDGAPLVWLFNPKCWTGVEIHNAAFKERAVEFSPAKPDENGDVLVIPRAKTDLMECAAEFFRVLRDPALFPGSAAPKASNSATVLSPVALRVADNGRFLTTQDDKPFFWLADTAWQLIHDLNREEADAYFLKRAAQGFNVIQTVALAEHGGLDRPNAYGFYPLLERDPTRPDLDDGPDYWKHVDYVVQSASRHGLHVALLPTWGSHVTRSYTDGKVNGIFNAVNAEAYGRFLSERYRQQTNIIWVLGGDRAAPTDEAKAVWRAMARGIAIGFSGREDYTQLLMTFHPVGPGSSSDYFPDEPWLDFHGIQSSHGPAILNWKIIGRDYLRKPVRPVIDMETTYAEIVFGKQTEPLSDDLARRAAYWAVFAGACGHTYGHNSVWQMFVPGKGAPRAGARIPWQAALDAPSAVQMGHLRKLMEKHPILSQRPDPSLIAFDQSIPSETCLALHGEGFALIYTPSGRTLELSLDKLGFAKVNASWFDPRTGKTTAFGQFFNQARHAFDPPGKNAPGNDWVLVLDDAEMHFAPLRQ